jgi:2-dehydropantoate 2-reductase
MRFAILGAGALGSILGAHLARAGHDVTLLARGRRAVELARDGLRLRGLAEVEAKCRVLLDPRELRATDTLIVATKAIRSREALASVRHLTLDSVFSLQNGVQKDVLLGQTFGDARVLGCVADFSGELLPDGVVHFTRNVCLHLGATGTDQAHGAHASPSRARAEILAGMIDASGVRSAVAADIRTLEWSKFAGWLAVLPLAVLTRRLTADYLSDATAAALVVAAARETAALAAADGLTLRDAPPIPVAGISRSNDEDALALVLAVGGQYAARAPEHRMSAQQDALRGRPLELEETLGFALERARALGVAMPTLDTCYRVMRAAYPEQI